MPDPISATGAVRTPTRFGAMSMGARQFTGLWTQRSPYRDAAVEYLVSKFYSGSRFDSIIDGVNREIGPKLTDVRSPGSSVYNSNTFPGAFSFYDWQYLQNNVQTVKLLYDGVDGKVYDATAGLKNTLYTKSAGSGQTRFQAVNTEVFFGDGVDQKKLLQGAQTWQAAQTVLPGTLIVVDDSVGPGTVQMALGGITMTIVATEVIHHLPSNRVIIYVDQENVPNNFTNLVNAQITFNGLTTATFLNGVTAGMKAVVSTTMGAFYFDSGLATSLQAYILDTGSATTGSGVTGGTAPSFSASEFTVVPDSGQQWKCYGPALQNWGLPKPASAPILSSGNGARFWQASTILSQYYAILDTNGNIEIAMGLTAGAGGIYKTGRSYPKWTKGAGAAFFNQTIDGTIVWWNIGAPSQWAVSTIYYVDPSQGVACLLDSNQNLQWCSNGSGGTSGTVPPTWNTAIGGTTADGALTWTCLGPGTQIASAGMSYAYSYHGLDGSISTASAPAIIQGGTLGPVTTGDVGLLSLLDVTGPLFSADSQIDQIYIWRTPQGQFGTLIFEDAIPVDGLTGNFIYGEFGIPDTSSNGQGALNAFILAPTADANNPPPVGFRPLCYALQAVWGVVKNMVVYSGGATTIVGNGNTAFPPGNEVPFPGTPYCIVPVTVQNGGLLVYTSNGIWIILGGGTSSNPFYATPYFPSVNVSGYNAVTLFNTTMFVMESNLKVSAIQVQYPFNPSTGYTEVGFPIGDQLLKVTTGGYDAALFNSASAFLTWNNQSTKENALYVASGAGLWFRMSAISPPETGYMWAPVRTITGGASAVQSCVTAPGVTNLLLAPAAGTTGPILMRDTTGTVYTDNGTPYAAYNTKGVNLLCSTGQWGEVAHISAKSSKVGTRPVVSVLLNEIEAIPTEGAAYSVLKVTGSDPARGRKSKSVFSDRYDLAQNGVDSLGDCILVRFDYGTQDAADELLDWGILASVHDERKEEAQK